jgi:hypothetical protein
MKYILTESQFALLSEDINLQRLKRRVTYDTMEKYINEAEVEFPQLCDDFSDEFEFADNVVSRAVDNFLDGDVFFSDLELNDEINDMVYNVTRDWFGDYLLEVYVNTCHEEDDEDMMFEQFETGVNSIVVKLFKVLNDEKKKVRTRKELLEVIKGFAPYFNIPEGYELYLLELYLLNYRKDGDYSGLTKENFVDPRDMKGKWTPNSKSNLYTKAQLPFQASNLRGFWTSGGGKKYYVVESWGWYPVFIYRDGIWYEISDRYSSSTGRQMANSQPYKYNDTLNSKVYLLTRDEMKMVENGVSHDQIMKAKRQKLKGKESELKSKRMSTFRNWGGWGVDNRNFNVKYKVNSVEEEGDKLILNVDIFDVVKREDGKGVPTPLNYLRGELPNVSVEEVENGLKRHLRNDFREYLGPRFDKMEDQNIEFRFNHLKK